jgi:dihydroflavonol-4-reductase
VSQTLVMGASGFLGSHVVKELIATGRSVRIMVRHSSDTRAWLRDPTPLYQTNVEGLRTVMNVALQSKLQRFIFTSTFGTIGISPTGISTEQDTFNWWKKAPDYIRCRVQAENLFMDYCHTKGLPGIACCVGNTYGGDDIVPTAHGKMVKDVVHERMPYYWDGGGPSVGIKDAARAMLLAEEKGRVELGWRPEPVEKSIEEAVQFYHSTESGPQPPAL